MVGKFNSLISLEQDSGLIPHVSPDAFAVAPEIDSTEELRVEIDDTDEFCPVRYSSDVRLILHTKDLASRAGLAVASKFGHGSQSASQIQQIMDKMSDDDLLNYKFFKVNPSVLDPIFGVNADSTWDTDQLLVNSYIGCYVARNLSRDGVPY